MPEVGIQSHALWGDYEDVDRAASLDAIAASGAGWVRLDVGWCSLQEVGRGQVSEWYVKRVTKVVDMALARGLQVLGTLWCTPGWANGGRGGATPPADVADYAAGARIISERLRGKVAAWEVWNEPNLSSFWEGKDPVRYAELLRAAYPAFKAGDPAAKVVMGAPAYNDVPWLTAVYAAGAAGSFDVMATHPYMGMADNAPELERPGDIGTLTNVAAVHALMAANGDRGKPIWFTEFGWSMHPNTGSEDNWERGVTPEQQADFLIRTLELVRARYPYVTHLFWYNDREKVDQDVHQQGYALLDSDLTPRPAYAALTAYLAAPTTAPLPTTSTPALPVPSADVDGGAPGEPPIAPMAPDPADALPTAPPAPTVPDDGIPNRWPTEVSSMTVSRDAPGTRLSVEISTG